MTPLPRELRRACADDPDRQHWVLRLPELVRIATERWKLEVDPPFEPGGSTAWVAPARRRGDACVLKVMYPHPEGAHEADALRVWNGNGAVRLLDAFTDSTIPVLLLEQCVPGTSLRARPEPEQDHVIASLLRRLWTAPVDATAFPSLQEMCDDWADRFESREPPPIDPAIVRAGVASFRELPSTASAAGLLCTDLHAGNVLAAEREPWLAIDPKPHVGDATYDALQHMLNCPTRLHADPMGLCRRIADLLDLDRDRLRRWLFARCVLESPTWPGLGELAVRLAP
jgi:streptomycin 6-kinase